MAASLNGEAPEREFLIGDANLDDAVNVLNMSPFITLWQAESGSLTSCPNK